MSERPNIEPDEPNKHSLDPMATLDECYRLGQLSSLLSDHLESISTNGRFPEYFTLQRQEVYWDHRVNHEQLKIVADAGGFESPSFGYKRYPGDNLERYDARNRVRLVDIATDAIEKGCDVDVADYGLTPERIASDTAFLQEDARMQEAYDRSEKAKSGHLKRVRFAQKMHEDIDPENPNTIPAVGRLVQADTLESVSLLEAPIKKDHIVPVTMAVVGGLAARQFLKSVESAEQTGNRTSFLWRDKTIQTALSSITHRYYGNVGSLIGMKLPVTDEFISEYFEDIADTELVPESVTRLQFDAVLKPDTKNPVISRVGTVIYEAENEKGDRRVVTTVRKADRMLASLAIQSMIRESSAITDIVRSGRYEYLTGHPGLGKRH